MRAFLSSLLLATTSLACNAVFGVDEVSLDETAAQGGAGRGGTVSGSSGQGGAGAGQAGAVSAGQGGAGEAGQGGLSGTSGQGGAGTAGQGGAGAAGEGGSTAGNSGQGGQGGLSGSSGQSGEGGQGGLSGASGHGGEANAGQGGVAGDAGAAGAGAGGAAGTSGGAGGVSGASGQGGAGVGGQSGGAGESGAAGAAGTGAVGDQLALRVGTASLPQGLPLNLATARVREACGPGEVATGLRGRRSAAGSATGEAIISFALQCSKITAVAVPAPSLTLTPGYLSAWHHDSGGFETWEAQCDEGRVVNSIKIERRAFSVGSQLTSPLPDVVTVRCVPLSVGAGGQLVVGFDDPNNAFNKETRGTGAVTSPGPRDCLDDDVAVGMVAFSSDPADPTAPLIDMSPLCAKATLEPNPEECTSDAGCTNGLTECQQVACLHGLCDFRPLPAGWPAHEPGKPTEIQDEGCKVRRCAVVGSPVIAADEPTQPEVGGCLQCVSGGVSRNDQTTCQIDGGHVCNSFGACVGQTGK